jgi:hypothetical protein
LSGNNFLAGPSRTIEKKPQVNLMDQFVNHLFSKALPHSLAPATERTIKNCAWLHHEPQLKWLNLTFLAIYAVGIVRYALHVGN